MTGPRRAGLAALTSFATGALLLLLAGPDLLRMAGAVLMLVAMFAGVTAIATPELLGDGEEDERTDSRAG